MEFVVGFYGEVVDKRNNTESTLLEGSSAVSSFSF
jgi:hypothetical protein